MTQIQQTLLTSAITIAGAVVVFALTQFAQRFWLDPLQEYAKAAANIDFTLLVQANIVGTPRGASQEERIEARQALRGCAARYQSAANAIRWWWLARLFTMVAKPGDVQLVIRNLIGLSNVGDGSHQEEPHVNTRWAKEIAAALSLRFRAK